MKTFRLHISKCKFQSNFDPFRWLCPSACLVFVHVSLFSGRNDSDEGAEGMGEEFMKSAFNFRSKWRIVSWWEAWVENHHFRSLLGMITNSD